MDRTTPLSHMHETAGARMVPFAGWSMPIQYRSILEEALVVRSAVGLFDLTHMGRFRFEGEDAAALLDRVTTHQASAMAPGRVRYGLLCQEDGGVRDDVLVYREAGGETWWLVVNASNADADAAWIREQAGASGFDASLVDETGALAMIALQGPRSTETLAPHTDCALDALGYYMCDRADAFGLENMFVSRTGYTGEDGFEIFVPWADAPRVWEALIESGRPHGLEPIGLGARDTLRLEAGMPLYGHELGTDINPIEAGQGWALRWADGHDFIGRAALEGVRATGPEKSLWGFTSETRRVPRQGTPVEEGGQVVGEVASGSPSPTLGLSIGTCFLQNGSLPSGAAAAPGHDIELDIRGEKTPATLCTLPFYKREK